MDEKVFTLLHGCVESFQGTIDGSLEGLSFFLSLGNALHKVYTKVKVNLSTWGDDFHQSELKAFYTNNQTAVDSLFRTLPVLDDKLLVPVPEGMSKPYDITSKVLYDACETFDVTDMTKKLLVYLKDLKSLSLDDKDAVEAFTSKHKDFVIEISAIPKASAKMDVRKCFNASRLLYKPIRQAFSHTSMIKETYGTLIKFDKTFADAVKYRETFSETTRLIDDVIHRLESAKSVPAKLCQNLFSVLTAFTWMIDLYGSILHDAQRVEHNYVSALATLIKEKKK